MADELKAMPEDYWKEKLTPEQYRVLREKGTEIPFSGEFLEHDQNGTYHCAACGAELFRSDSKYQSRQLGLEGWPSFAEVARSDAIELREDKRYGLNRVELSCRLCGSHLGHIFPDEGSPSGKHYCVNSIALNFEPMEK